MKSIEYNQSTQKLLLEYLISDENLFSQSRTIIKPSYWERPFNKAVNYVIDYVDEYKSLPTIDIIKSETSVDLKNVENPSKQSQWFLETIENFCRHKAMELLIYDGPELLEKGEYSVIEQRSKDNVMISLQKDLGTDYFQNPKLRLEKMKDRTNMTPTGWRDIDSKLYGGLNRGELTFFVGGPGCVSYDTKVKIIKRHSIGESGNNQKLGILPQPMEIEIGSLYGNISSGEYVVESPDGYVPVLDCVIKPYKKMFKISLENGYEVKASFDHLFQKSNGEWEYADNINIGDILITDMGNFKIRDIKNIPDEIVYDLSVDHENHRYFTNGICSHNTGKSLFLQNLALNWIQGGKNVLYISLELSEELVGLRFDSMITGLGTRKVFSEMDRVSDEITMLKKFGKNGINWGKFQIKKMPEAGTTVNTIRAYIKEYELQTGIKIDGICVDYLDLLYPNNNKVDINSAFTKDKYTSEELRGLANELNILCATASQLNRASTQEQNFDASHIAGGISKINTADNVLGIFVSQSMKENGEYQIQFLKTRSSNGVGSKVWLSFDTDSLRITDSNQTDDDALMRNTGMAGVSKMISKKSSEETNYKETIDSTKENKISIDAIREMAKKNARRN